MLGAPCPAAVLRAAAAYAAFEATTQGWLSTSCCGGNAWSTAASALQACCAVAGSSACPSPNPTSPIHSQPGTLFTNENTINHYSCTGISSTRGEPRPLWRWGDTQRGHRGQPQRPTIPRTQPSPPLQPRDRLTPPATWPSPAWARRPASAAKAAAGAAAPPQLEGPTHLERPLAGAQPRLPRKAARCWSGGREAPGLASSTAATVPSTSAITAVVWRGDSALQSTYGGLGGVSAVAATPLSAAEEGWWQLRRRQRQQREAQLPAVAAAAAAVVLRSASSHARGGTAPAAGAASAAAESGRGDAQQQQQQPVVKAKEQPLGFVGGGYDVGSFPPERIRNFSIIAHVDHGKSTLADRLLEMTGALGARATHNAQYLDKLQVERERGITVKAQTVSLVYLYSGVPYLLNLIDTPGHVDFSYEVSRSLAACQGALLLVDAGQGIQAQTVANFYLAFEQGMDLIPVVNKIDLPAADPAGCAEQMSAAFDLEPSSVLYTSAKTGQGMEAVLPAVVERIRPPHGDPSAPLRMLLFDAFHDEYRGVVLLVEVVDGAVAVGQRLAMASTGAVYEVQEVGIQAPERHATGRLLTGQVGYLLCGIKDLKAARVGDTIYHAPNTAAGAAGAGAGPAAEAGAAAAEVPAALPPRLPGFKPAKAMVFAGLFPLGGDGQEFESLATAMDKLLLNDASVVVKRENSEALGPGFRCGFLGMLHMEIFTQRLQHEYGASVVTTTPMVPYILEMPDGSTITLENASDYPMDRKVSQILEPTVTATLICPDGHLGRLIELCAGRRGEQLEHTSLGGSRTLLRYRLPLAELAGDFYSAVKSRSQGYASFDYEEGPYRPADLVRLDILAHGRTVDALARMVPREAAAGVGRALLGKMCEGLDRQQFEVVLQAAADGRIVARETLKALRRNVTAKCYGGDVTRKRKLLDRQKEGKRRMKRLGSIDVPQELFPELMKTR